MRNDRERQQALRLAHAFNRPDVDQFLSEIDHDQYVEWCAFFATEPTGWRAVSLQTQRITFIAAQIAAGKRKLDERKFAHELHLNQRNPAVERARLEAMSIRSERAARQRQRK